jgi:hypothetical protein
MSSPESQSWFAIPKAFCYKFNFCFGLRGRLAQLVRALPSHGRGQRFKSFVAHHSLSFVFYLTSLPSPHRRTARQFAFVCLRSSCTF